MKRAIVVECILTVAFAFCLALCVHEFIETHNYFLEMEYYRNNPDPFLDFRPYFNEALTYGILALVAALCDLAAMVLIALHNFPCFKPLLDKLAAKRAAQKQATATAKAEKAEADKQARIERLTAELEELKKDE